LATGLIVRLITWPRAVLPLPNKDTSQLMCTVANFALAIAWGVKASVPLFFFFKFFSRSLQAIRLQVQKFTEAVKTRVWVRGALSMGAAADVITAVTLCYYLRKFKTGFKRLASFYCLSRFENIQTVGKDGYDYQ
jgi:hypothetical protein